MNARLVTLGVVAMVACTPQTETSPPHAVSSKAAPTADVSTEEGPSPAAAEPEAAVAMADVPVADVPVVEVPIVGEQWRPPLTSLSKEPLDEAEQERTVKCFETHHLLDPEVNPHELMAGAVCLRGARAYGKEVSLYRMILGRYPELPEGMEATRLLGLRLEQLDHRSGALDVFREYLQRYPRQEDARAIGMRAVCLARSVMNDQREEELLGLLDRYFRRRGFVRPSPQDMPGLCGEIPSE